MIGHSTVLIEAAGIKLLTDPYFNTWGNPGYARICPPAKSREELASVDVVVVSHGHFDHVDTRFLSSLPSATPVIVPRFMEPHVWHARHKVVRQPNWKSTTIGAVTVTTVPALHPAIAVGYIIEAEGKVVYFAGDTYYRPFINVIGSRYKLDVALLPVMTYRIPMTMSEKGAVKEVEALKPKMIIPIHLGIRPRSPLMRTGQSVEGFQKRLEDSGAEAKFVLLKEGESTTIEE